MDFEEDRIVPEEQGNELELKRRLGSRNLGKFTVSTTLCEKLEHSNHQTSTSNSIVTQTITLKP